MTNEGATMPSRPDLDPGAAVPGPLLPTATPHPMEGGGKDAG